MRTLIPTALAVAALLAVAGSASAAAAPEMNDATYLALARCAGMAQGVGANAAPFTSALDVQSSYRTSDVVDRADEARRDAKRDADHEGSDGKATITQKLDGPCKSYIGG